MKMIITNYSNPIAGQCGIVYSATLELTDPDNQNGLQEAFGDNSAIMNLDFNESLFEFLTLSCESNHEIHMILKDLKFDKALPEDSRIEAVKKLTKSEYPILKSLSEGLTYEAIGNRHNKSYETVKSHMSNIFAKLNVHDRNQASAIFMKFLLRYPLYDIERN